MSIVGYRRLTFVLGFLSFVLLLAVGGLLPVVHEYAGLECDVRFAGEVISSIREDTRFAMKEGICAAADELHKLSVPEEMRHPRNPAMMLIEEERTRAIADLIGFLRRETGKDLGSSPDPWIQESASK